MLSSAMISNSSLAVLSRSQIRSRPFHSRTLTARTRTRTHPTCALLRKRHPLYLQRRLYSDAREKKTENDEEEDYWKPTEKPKSPSFMEDPEAFFKSLPSAIWDFLKHTYVGFKLFGLNIRTATGLALRAANGHSLTRRERKLLVTATADLFRMVPFSFFIIIPGAEILLPFAIKLFPNMVPSTFSSASEEEEKMYKELKAKLELAKFLQQTATEMKNPTDKFEGDFNTMLKEITAAKKVDKEEIYRFVKLFSDNVTLENLKRSQILAMCKYIGIRPFGPTDYLRKQLSARVKALRADDKIIAKEGVHNLSLIELKEAVAARGMSSYGPRREVEALMQEWLELSLDLKVPTAMLILSRAFRLFPHQTPEGLLRATIVNAPPSLLEDTKRKVNKSQSENVADYEAQLERLKEERKKIEEEEEKQDTEGAAYNLSSGSSSKGEGVDDLQTIAQVSDVLVEKAIPLSDEKVELDDLVASIIGGSEGDDSAEIRVDQKVLDLIKSIKHEIKEAEGKIAPSFDIDGDGIVTKDELRQGLDQMKLTEQQKLMIMEQLDIDKDGVIHLEDMKAAAQKDSVLSSSDVIDDVSERVKKEVAEITGDEVEEDDQASKEVEDTNVPKEAAVEASETKEKSNASTTKIHASHGKEKETEM